MFKVLKKNFILALLACSNGLGFAGGNSDPIVVKPEGDASSVQSEERGVRLENLFSKDSVDFLGNVKVKGEARFLTIYRTMDDSYRDQEANDNDLQFVTYPQTQATQTANSAVPLLNLQLLASPSPYTDFDLGYSLNHSFSGEASNASKDVSVRSNLNFGGKFKTKLGTFNIKAGGGVLWTNLSPLTMSNQEFYRVDQFDRLPWDWFVGENGSWRKYNGLYRSATSMGGESYGDVAFQGLKVKAQGLPAGFTAEFLMGRTNFSTDQDGAFNQAPSLLTGGRLDKIIGKHKVGFNVYNQQAYVNPAYDSLDLRRVLSLDGKFSLKNVRIFTEVGLGTIKNPAYELPDSVETRFKTNNGLAFIAQVDVSEKMFGLPLTLNLYSIDHNVVSNVSSVLNSNYYTPAGGYAKEQKYNGMLLMNITQDVGQLANNRQGFALRTSKFLGNLGIELGAALSQEKENIYDTVTVFHRANSFSRSRFTPWVQDAGPYGSVRNTFRRAYETVAISNPDSSGAKKGFSAFDVVLKHKFNVGSKKNPRDLIVKNFFNYNTVQSGFAPKFNEEAYVRTMYNQFMAFLQVSSRITLIGMAEFETVKGSVNAVTVDSEGNTNSEETFPGSGEYKAIYDADGSPLDQLGTGFGVGLDYDFSDIAGIYLRHRWMSHEDKNFTQDKFKGQETTIEFKVFF